MAGLESGGDLVGLCLKAASESRESVERWRRQVRTLEKLPSQLADSLLRHLVRRRLVFPSLLEVFKHSVEEVDLRGENSVDAEWMAYVGAFSYLLSLNISDCNRITNAALWSITGMANLKELNLSRCSKVSDAGIGHVISILTLEKLWIAETSITADGVKLLSSLTKLSVLDLGGLPVTDLSLASLLVLTGLQYLDLWGSKISNKGASSLTMFLSLRWLNLAWTSVTKLPNLSSLTCLNMSNCTINSIFEGDGEENAPLEKLVISGATLRDVPHAFVNVNARSLSFFDASNTALDRFSFLAIMNSLQHLDLSGSMLGDDSVELIATIGEKLRNLNLDNTRVSSAGLGILVGHVPNLEIFSLSQTPIDDAAFSYLGLMPSLRVISLNNTNIKGFVHEVGNESNRILSLSALQSLNFLERLDLQGTKVGDSALYPLQRFQELRHLTLRSAPLSDLSLYDLSFVPKLTYLGIRDAVLTNGGLDSFNPPPMLEILDLNGCWLLTEDCIYSFCDKFPQIEVRHEFLPNLSSVTNGLNRSIPQMPLKDPKSKQKQQRSTASQSSAKNISYTDQRLKYSKEELLAMNYSSVSDGSSNDRDTVISNVEMD